MKPITEAWIQAEFWRNKRSGSKVIVPNRHVPGWFEADILSVSKARYWSEWEIKLSIADFNADFNKRAKHRRLADMERPDGPKFFTYIMPEELAERVNVPEYAGLIAVSSNTGRWLNFRTIKNAPPRKSKKVTDKALSNHYQSLACRWWDAIGSTRR